MDKKYKIALQLKVTRYATLGSSLSDQHYIYYQ